MAGRQSSSWTNDVGAVAPVRFSKTGAQTVATLPGSWRNHGNTPRRLLRTSAHVGTAPTGASLVVNVLVDGVSVYNATGDRLAIPAGQKSAENKPSKTDLDAISVKPGQVVTVDVTQVGSTVAGSDLEVALFLG